MIGGKREEGEDGEGGKEGGRMKENDWKERERERERERQGGR